MKYKKYTQKLKLMLKSLKIASTINFTDEITYLKKIDNLNLAIGSTTGKIQIFNLTTSNIEKFVNGHSEIIYSVEYLPISFHSPRSEEHCPILISGSRDKKIVIWNYNTNHIIKILKGNNHSVVSLLAVNINYGNNILISGSWDTTVRVWNLEKFEQTHIFKVNIIYIHKLLLIEGLNQHKENSQSNIMNNSILCISRRLEIYQLNFLTGLVETKFSLSDSNEYSGLLVFNWEKNTKSIVYGNYIGEITYKNIESKNVIFKLQGHDKPINCLEKGWNSDNILISGAWDYKINVWNLNCGELVSSIKCSLNVYGCIITEDKMSNTKIITTDNSKLNFWSRDIQSLMLNNTQMLLTS